MHPISISYFKCERVTRGTNRKGILKRKEVILEDLYSSGLNKGNVSEDDVGEPSSSKFHSSFFLQASSKLRRVSQQQLNQGLKIQTNSLSQQVEEQDVGSKIPLVDYTQIQDERCTRRIEQNQELILAENSQKSSFAINGKLTALNEVWKSKGLQILGAISCFSKQLKIKSSIFRFKLLNRSILQFIGDASSDHEEIMKMQKNFRTYDVIREQINKIFIDNRNPIKGFFSEIKTKMLLYESIIPPIQPDSVMKIIWDIVLLIFMIGNIFFIPMRLSFSFQAENYWKTFFIFQIIPSWFLVVDIIINFNSAYYSKGMIHTDRTEIRNNYMRSNFKYDLLMVLPYFASSLYPSYSDYILLLRAFRVKKMVEDLEEILNLKDIIQAMIDLIKSVFFLIYVAHLTACAWHLIGKIQAQKYGSGSWLIYYKILDSPWQTRYIQSVYFSTITTLTIGYGDLSPQTDIERVFVIMMAFLICGVFGYTISSIGEIFKNIHEKENKVKNQMKYINQYLKSRDLNKQLRLKIRKYFEYYFKLENSKNTEGERLIGQLTKKLKEELHEDLYFQILTKSKIIKQCTSTQTIQQLCQYVKEKTYAPEEDLFQRGDQSSKLLYVIQGDVNIMTADHKHILKRYSQGQFICEREFAINDQYKFSARAEKFTTLAYLQFDDFYKLVKENNLDFKNFCMMRDKIKFDPNHNNFGQICDLCLWTHSLEKCPLVFHQPNKDKLSKLFQQNYEMKRFPQTRIYKYKNTKANLQQIQECALAHIINKEIYTIQELNDNLLLQLGFKIIIGSSSSIDLQQNQAKNQKDKGPVDFRKVGTQMVEFNASTFDYPSEIIEQPFIDTAQNDICNNQLNVVSIGKSQSTGLASKQSESAQLQKSVKFQGGSKEFKEKIDHENKMLGQPDKIETLKVENVRKSRTSLLECQNIRGRTHLMLDSLISKGTQGVSQRQINAPSLSPTNRTGEHHSRRRISKDQKNRSLSQLDNPTKYNPNENFYHGARIDFDIDKHLADSQQYFPNFELKRVLSEIQTHQKAQTKVFNSMQSALPFLKIQHKTQQISRNL